MNVGTKVRVNNLIIHTIAGANIDETRNIFLGKEGVVVAHNYPEEGLLNYVNFGDPNISYGFYDLELEVIE